MSADLIILAVIVLGVIFAYNSIKSGGLTGGIGGLLGFTPLGMGIDVAKEIGTGKSGKKIKKKLKKIF